MKRFLSFLLFLTGCTSSTSEDSDIKATIRADITSALLDTLSQVYESDNTKHVLRYFEKSADSTIITLHLDPDYGMFPNDDDTQNSRPYIIRVPSANILRMNDSYIVKYYFDNTDGNHLPAWYYTLAKKNQGRWKFSEPFLTDLQVFDATITGMQGKRLTAVTTIDKFGDVKSYYELKLKADSLLIVKEITVKDTL